MKKLFISICFILFFTALSFSQAVKYIIPDSGYQGTNFPITIIGTSTQWTVSNYFEIYFDSTGVSADFVDSTHVPNDTTIYTNIHISNKAVTIPRGIYVLDKFTNVYYRDSALRVLLTIPPAPTLILPPNNATNQLQFVTLLWDSNAYATTFRIQLSTDSLFTTNIIFDSTVANTPLIMRPNFLTLGAKYYWRVNATNFLGTSGWSAIWNFTVRTVGINHISSEVPNSYKLFNNYPNPFNPITKIKFQIPKTGIVELKIFDITGKTLTTLVNGILNTGVYELAFDASAFSSGMYFVKMQTENYTGVIRIALVK